MNLFEGLLFGVVQGLTEFLPVSSSAHLTLLPWLLGWADPGLGFDVALHTGTLVAVLWYFWRDWWELAQGALRSASAGQLLGNPEAELFWKVAAASVPAALIGVAFEHAAEEALRSPLLIATTLTCLGLLLGWADTSPETITATERISWSDALWIGCTQAAAIVPGVSRSGVTITTARFRGVAREPAARFSFLLSTPIIAGATILKVKSLIAALHDPGQLLALVASAVAGFAAIGVLMRYVRSKSYRPFVVYRLAVAAFVVLVYVTRG